jgi:GTP cyclohydrolase IA
MKMRSIIENLLWHLDPESDREGLKETPDRVAKSWCFMTGGYELEPADILKTFADGADNYNEMILVKNIPLYSHCEHHLVPFFGVAHVAYIPNGRIVGLSKINRLVDMFARRLQVQERLTTQVADAIMQHLAPAGVGVVLECRHLCMEMRGVCQQGHTTTTSCLRGVFLQQEVRAEFLRLIR